MIVATIWGSMSDDNSYNSEESIKARALDRKREDFADLQNELAGRDNGRMSRFLSAEERDRRNGQSNDRTRHRTTMLDLLLQDAAYRELYNNTMADLADAENAVYEALVEAARHVKETAQALEDTLDRAAKLPDGTKVFRGRDGKVYTEDGEEVDAASVALISWPDDAPSWEDYQKLREAHDDARADHSKLVGYQSELDDIRAHMEDPENPPTKDDMNGYRQRIKDIGRDAVKANNVENEMAVERPENTEVPDLDLGLPGL